MENETISRIGGAMKELDLVFVDTETTGLDANQHEIIEIGLVRVKQEWSVGEKPKFTFISEWSAKIKPLHLELADPKALLINGYTPNGWTDAISASDAITLFSEKTNGAIMVAHNVAFDAGFIDNYFKTYGIKNKMHYSRLDTISMAYIALQNNPALNGLSLPELCNYFDITNEHAHSALSDARADFELFKKLMDFKPSL